MSFLTRSILKTRGSILPFFVKHIATTRASDPAKKLSIPIKHDQLFSHFYIEYIRGDPQVMERAFVEYQRIDCRTFELTRVFIPDILEGQGIEEKLAEVIFDHMKSRNVNIRIKSEYLKQYFDAYLRDDPLFAKKVTKV